MKVTTITVTRTIQIRQYEPYVVSATAEVEDGVPPFLVATHLGQLVDLALWEASHKTRRDLAPAAVDGSEEVFDPRD